MDTSVNKICLITAIFGDLDDLKPVPLQTVQADQICFTNSDIIPKEVFNGWKIIHPGYPRHDMHNRMKAKYFRMLSHNVKELKPYNIHIWRDASIDIISEDFISFMAQPVMQGGLCVFKHSTRDCIYDEAIASTQSSKYTNEPLLVQAEEYRSCGYPEKNGLIETGCFSRFINDETNKIMEDWWHENIKYTYQDQVSLPYVLWKNKFSAYYIKKNIHNNEYCVRPPRAPEKEIL